MEWHTLDVAALVSFLVILTLAVRHAFSQNTLPPGPKPVPLLGNLFQLSHKQEWLQFTSWGQIYGLYLSWFLRRGTPWID